jgi:hypothetical protein
MMHINLMFGVAQRDQLLQNITGFTINVITAVLSCNTHYQENALLYSDLDFVQLEQ